MSKDFPEIVKNLNQYIGKFSKEVPDVMQGYMKLHSSASQAGAIDKKTKELLALAIAVSIRCEGCIGFHVQKLVSLGVSKEELMETLALSVSMGGGPSLMYAAEAVQAYEQFNKQ